MEIRTRWVQTPCAPTGTAFRRCGLPWDTQGRRHRFRAIASRTDRPHLSPAMTKGERRGRACGPRSCGNLGKAGYRHESVDHGTGDCVRDHSHANSMEGFRARLKLSIRGTHVHVSGKRLQNYAKAFEFRYNRRQRPETMFSEPVSRLRAPGPWSRGSAPMRPPPGSGPPRPGMFPAASYSPAAARSRSSM